MYEKNKYKYYLCIKILFIILLKIKYMTEFKSESKFIDNVFQSIYTLLDKGDTYNIEVLKKVTLLGDDYSNMGVFSIVIYIEESNVRYNYRYNIYHKNGIIPNILRKFSWGNNLVPYFLKVDITRNGFTQDSYLFKSNKSNYESYKDLYKSLLDSKTKKDKEKYEKSLSKWCDLLMKSGVSASRKRDLKLNKLIKEENK